TFSSKGKTSNGVRLGIVPVRIQGNNGHIVANAMLDSGSDTTLISDAVVNKLGLKGHSTYLNIETALGVKRQHCLEIELNVMSLSGEEIIHVPRAYSVPRVLQSKVDKPDPVRLASWKHLSGVKLESIDTPGVDLLIGLDVPEAHWVFKQRRGRRKEPHVDRTLLGWVLRGPMHIEKSNNCRTFASVTQSDDVQMNLQLLYDHEFGDVDSCKKSLSKQDELAVAQAESSMKLVEGHFCIGLPWRVRREDVSCPNSVAAHRLSCLRRRLVKDESMKVKYVNVLQKYIEKGFAKSVSEEQNQANSTPKWYLPHHSVFNMTTPDKIRVVFDCAATYKDVSLNHNHLQGPNVMQSLVGVNLWFNGPSFLRGANRLEKQETYFTVVPKLSWR
ncbi:aspartyl protease family protein, partial [Streptococcus dysgalactiae]|uniref:aspartyl protease family protein n=1 Tax=Streptococcus dysgalactiae TaxID=1334 RepID=UPI00194EF8A0